MLWGLASLLLHSANAFFLTRLLVRGTSRAATVLGFSLFFSLQIVVAGHILSCFNLFGDVRAWCGFDALTLLGTLGSAAFYPPWRELAFRPLPPWRETLRSPLAGQPLRDRAAGICAVLAFACILGGQAYLVGRIAPRNWDSMTLHLSRVAFYLQQGNLSPFPTNWIGHIVHPTAGVCLHAYAFLSTGGNERLTQCINWFSYLTTIVAIYGCCRLMNLKPAASLLAGLTFGLLTICVLQAVSTQTDMEFTGWVAVSVYFLVAHWRERSGRYLVLAGMAAVLPVGIKASALLVIPAIGVVALYAVVVSSRLPWKQRGRDFAVFAAAATWTTILVIVPAGYWQNWQRYGHPMGPASIRELHSFDGRSVAEVLQHGSTNIFRYALSFARMDGQRHAMVVLQQDYFDPAQRLIGSLGIDMEDPEGLRVKQWTYRQCLLGAPTCEDASWWGILGVVLIWPCVFWALINPRGSGIARTMAVASIVFFLTQCFSGPYDPWRGRYFVHCAIFALPCVGAVLSQVRSRFGVAVLTVVFVAGFDSAGHTVRQSFHAVEFSHNRLAQMVTRCPILLAPLQEYERAVPPDAVVAFHLRSDFYLYPFFGKRLTRELHSKVDFHTHENQMPAGSEFFLFHAELDPPQPGDLELGQDLYLRDLRVDRIARRPGRPPLPRNHDSITEGATE